MATHLDDLRARDFYSWSREQAEALRRAAAERVNVSAPVDWAGLAEEIGDLGVSQERELWSRLRVVLVHLLKWQFQPERRSASWEASVDDNRDELATLLRRSPGLKRIWRAELEDAYPSARRRAAKETGLPLATFPERCPYPVERALDPNFWPGPSPDARRPDPG